MKISVLLVAIVSLFLAACAGASSENQLDPAPPLQFSLYQGEEVVGATTSSLSQLAGKPVLVNFWAAFCPPCRAEIPEFQEVYEEYKDQIVLLGIDVGRFTGQGSAEDAKDLLVELKASYPAGSPIELRTVVESYNVLGIPKTVFVTSNGEIFAEWSGPLNKEKLSELVNELLAAEQG